MYQTVNAHTKLPEAQEKSKSMQESWQKKVSVRIVLKLMTEQSTKAYHFSI